MDKHDDHVWELFASGISAAGGLRKMVSGRRLRWLPDMLESAYTIVLQEEEHRNPREIADLVGTTLDSVESMLTGPADIALEKIGSPPPENDLEREHIAGGLIRLIYEKPMHGAEGRT